MVTLTTEEATLLGGIIGGMAATTIMTFSIIGIALAVLLVVANWKIFEKAGEKGWKSLIPIYNTYIEFKIVWNTKMFWYSIGIPFALGLIGGLSGEGSFLFGLMTICASIFTLVLYIILNNRLAKSFGHGTGYTLGLIFLPNIFTLILGFNKDKYKKLAD